MILVASSSQGLVHYQKGMEHQLGGLLLLEVVPGERTGNTGPKAGPIGKAQGVLVPNTLCQELTIGSGQLQDQIVLPTVPDLLPSDDPKTTNFAG